MRAGRLPDGAGRGLCRWRGALCAADQCDAGDELVCGDVGGGQYRGLPVLPEEEGDGAGGHWAGAGDYAEEEAGEGGGDEGGEGGGEEEEGGGGCEGEGEGEEVGCWVEGVVSGGQGEDGGGGEEGQGRTAGVGGEQSAW